ncbi:protein-(glutamine-N5) methyltransferase, release factor-specific [Rhodomicrobium vannielii ATCC 17100]|uniref:Release factor glutamine methyltransferase n=1 Tax=Rhodomicrobium vannielii (strain ATCC 17100 / DSM 162 / LMG 4299 / NCIMB 10020 / ATH 3.1.1) TaxID=648757 RepID=E3I815_RHOVT|nr:peptide chain release factor N(5)-glutamine methyltransferase [Rhodomicrobium vannielii]ADP71941.1 protein-(glutamine-N5) methyltransferase, release factor-specific [Rhodomicrobium vannielii ATCC 17100]
MTTFAELVRYLAERFRQAGIESAALDARLLSAYAAGFSSEEIVTKRDTALPPEILDRAIAVAQRRFAGEPVSRIVGTREFWGMPFGLSPHTLDPRPDTEVLVDAGLAWCRKHDLANAPLRILDLGTGTGCILAALLSELPKATGVGVDRSEGALRTARANFARLGLSSRAFFFCGDWGVALADATFDIIACNPPYIETADIAGLCAEVRDFDPALALDGGKDGLKAYRDIVPQASRLLRVPGLLIFETGHRQARSVRDMVTELDAGFQTEIFLDLAGIERAVAGVRQSGGDAGPGKKKVGNPVGSG